MKVTLFIETAYESRTVEVENEISIGRTAPADIVLDDAGLSRLNTTIFVEDDEALVTDENSTNGTFLNGGQVVGRPRVLQNGDRITIGSNTTIRVQIGDNYVAASAVPVSAKTPSPTPATVNAAVPTPSPKTEPAGGLPLLPIVAGAMMLLIILFGAVGFWLASQGSGSNGATTSSGASERIPVRVIDPLGGEDPDDLNDLIASWEVEEKPLTADELKAIDSVSETDPNKPSDLNVPIDFWRQQLSRALNHGATGAEPGGLIPLPIELVGGTVIKQRAKLSEMINRGGYKQPLDFADLAQHRIEGKFLVELPMATESYVLDIGGSASGAEFTSFEFASDGSQVRAPIVPGSPKYQYLKQLADNFDGQKYDLNDPGDRKQMRIRLLRMYNKNSRKELETLTNAFYQRFKVPLRITSLTRSMDYQIELNKGNANSFKVSGKGSLPPHTSGCAFDVSRKNLTKDEQNFLMQTLAELERGKKLDSLREGAANACFHSFIYPDGVEAPTSLVGSIYQSIEMASNDLNFPFTSVAELSDGE